MAYRILIDAGHFTNQNRPNNFPSYCEGNMTWELFTYLTKELKEYGFEVNGTRSNRDTDIEVYKRGQMAKGYDLMLSLHSNACDTESVRRVVVIVPFKDVNGTNSLADKLGQTVTNCIGIKDKFQRYTRTYKQNNTDYDYYGVIRGAVAAGCKRSIIIEHSFHTNNETAKWLNNSANLAKLAKEEAKAIADYFGVKKQTSATPTPAKANAEKIVFDSLKEIQKEVANLSSMIDVLIKSIQS